MELSHSEIAIWVGKILPIVESSNATKIEQKIKGNFVSMYRQAPGIIRIDIKLPEIDNG
jgi:hypothetical protein